MSSAARVERLESLLKKTLQRRRAIAALRGGRVSALEPIHGRIEVISAVLAWALRNQDEPPSVQRCSAALGLVRHESADPRLAELVERVYAWAIAVACELLTIENLCCAGDIDDDFAELERYAPRAIALLDDTVGPLLVARKTDDLAFASIRRIVSDLRQTLVLAITPNAIAIAA